MNLHGKTILFLGSSVTYGSAAGGVSFADMLSEFGCTVVKEAVSGTTLVDTSADSYVSRMKAMDKALNAELTVKGKAYTADIAPHMYALITVR